MDTSPAILPEWGAAVGAAGDSALWHAWAATRRPLALEARRWHRAIRRGLIPWPLAFGLLALVFSCFTSQMQQSAQLQHTLEHERSTAASSQRLLTAQLDAANGRDTSLETDLKNVEDEADRLYQIVGAIRTLSDQLRDRVGLAGPGIEPLPELPPPPAPHTTKPGGLAAVSGPEEGSLVAASLPSNLPPNTGPWPADLLTQPFAPHDTATSYAARLAAANDAVGRQWDAWQQLAQSVDQVLGQRSRAARPSLWPVRGVVTSPFGRRAGFWGVLAYHTGLDISVPVGTAVVAAADGKVTFAGFVGDYGYNVQIQHTGGLLTLYGHLSRPLVRVGQQVSQGQVIALSGNSGISTGPHLHYEIRLNGTPVDPAGYL